MITLREMEQSDLPAVINLIDSHDEDDAEAAEASYEQDGLEGQYVALVDDKVIGVSGYRAVAGCDRTYWLSWTYVHDDSCGNGYGRQMLMQVLNILREQKGRKIFVRVSDYVDPDDGPIYAAALHLYKILGFEMEIEFPHYYDEGETQMILGLYLSDEHDDSRVADEDVAIKFNALFEISETSGSYSFGWGIEGKRCFDVNDLKIGINAAREKGGRAVYLSFPSNIPTVQKPLSKAGFELVGRLKDFYESGVDDLHYRYILGNG